MTKKAKISFLIVVWSIVAIQMYVNYEQRIRLREEAVTAFSVEQMVEILEKSKSNYENTIKSDLRAERKCMYQIVKFALYQDKER